MITDRGVYGPLRLGSKCWGFLTRRGIRVLQEPPGYHVDRDQLMRFRLWGVTVGRWFVGVISKQHVQDAPDEEMGQ